MRMVLFIISLLIGQSAFATEWNWQHPVPQGNTLWRSAFYNEWTGYAVGDFGTIMVTYDQGVTWQLQYEGITDNLRDLFLSDSATLWIVGDNGTIFFTSNGGDRWTEQTSATSMGLNGVFFVDRTNGWACGDTKTILRTSDGGLNWGKATLPSLPMNTNLNSIFFTSINEGWCVGSNGIILHTTDSGMNWSLQTITGITLLRVKFYTQTSGYTMGDDGALYSTTNSGVNWNLVSTGTAYGLNDMLFMNSTDFWISGDNGTLLHSTNAGSNWSNESLATYASLNGIAKASNLLFAVGEYGVLARRVNTSSWTFLNSGDNRAVNWITFADLTNGWGVGQYGIILHTTDGGNVWSEQINGITGDSFYGAEATDASNLWLVGDLGVLLHTSDAGQHWVQQSTYTINTLLSISFIDNLHGWAVGDAGELLQTMNGGNLWARKSSGVSDILFGVKFLDAVTGWIVGDNGIIRKTTDGGATWSNQVSGVTDAIFNIDFLDSQHGYCGGANGVVLKTTNGGSVWTKQTTGTQRNIYVVDGTNSNALWAVGDSGLVIYSTDFGATWNTQFAKMGYDIFGLNVKDTSAVWLCGDNGTIMRYGISSPVQLPSITVVSPNGGEVWQGGTHQSILWTSMLVNDVTIDYSTNGGSDWATIISSTPASGGFYSWFVPSLYSTAMIIRVSDFVNPVITDVSNGTFTVAQNTLGVSAGWNLISSPVILEDPLSEHLFIGAASSLYYYAGYYVKSDTITEGRGYWIKYGISTVLNVPGEILTRDTLSLAPQWNMIGGLSYPVPISAIEVVPPNALASNFFGYQTGGGYHIPDTIQPGKGYWIKTSEPAQIILDTAVSLRREGEPGEFSSLSLSTLIFTDAECREGRLYLDDDCTLSASLGYYELPPIPPDGIFDVRFSSQRYMERFSLASAIRIEVSAARYPLSIQILMTDALEHSFRIVEKNGGTVVRTFPFSQNKCSIPSQVEGTLWVEKLVNEPLPAEFGLGQNYPNPLNPTTTIHYQIPSACKVLVMIYDIVGEEVIRLVNADQGAGRYHVTWDGTNRDGLGVSSGVYYLRMRAGEYVDTKKVLVVR